MITAFRRYLDTWPVRGFFLIMVAAFVVWGVGDVVRMVGTSTWIAKIGDITIEAQAYQAEFQQAMGNASRNLPQGQEATPQLRRQVGDQTLQRMIGQAAFSLELRDLRIVTPDAAVAETARAMPAFKGPDGKFSKPQFDALLRNNNLTEARFLDMLRGDLAQRQVASAVSAGAFTPDAELNPIYASEFEKRSADIAAFPVMGGPDPAEPDEAALHRWYDNHPDLYATPEYRRIKLVELSPQTLSADIQVSDADLRAWFEQHHAEYVTIAKRTVQVISSGDQTKLAELATKWRGGADWAAMQEAATAAGASAVSFDDATEAQFPDPDLGKAVFAATPDSVTDPVKGALSSFIVKVTKATPGSMTTFEQAKDAVRERVTAERATDLMYERANKVDNLLANGTSLDELPGDLGLAGAAGTVDSNGNTPDGSPAPIPGGKPMRDAVIATAFQTQKGDPPRLAEAQLGNGITGYYALVVEDITPPASKPFDTVRDRVREDVVADLLRKAQEVLAANMLTALRNGQNFSDAATIAGVTPHVSALVTRNQGDPSMPPELHRVLFSLKKGEPTMVETPEAFIVAIPAEIVEPDPKADPAGYAQARAAVTRSIAQDLEATFVQAIRLRANPRINQTNVDQIIQP